MPELPEVETFKRYLDETSLKQTIKNVKVIDNRVLKVDENFLKKSVVSNRFESSIRHGKYLLINLGKKYLVMHFGMTGDLEYYNKKYDNPKFSKIIFQFDNGFNLAYISVRMFGNLDVTDSIKDFIIHKKLGPDAYKMTFEEFSEALNRRSAILKTILLDQSFIAGIGNIYSDEILFRTRLNPKTKIDTLDNNKLNELFNNIKEVLKFGIEKKGDLSTYPNEFLIPHRQKEDHCPICERQLERYDLSGRRGFYCPNCQKK